MDIFFFYLDDGCRGTNHSYSNNFTECLQLSLLDGKETWRKLTLFTVGSVGELIASAKTELSEQVSLDRILRFDTDFQEFIDTDVNAGVQELDTFQIYYIASNIQDLLEGSVQPLQVNH